MYYVRRRLSDSDSYSPIDPFKPSVALGVNNILGGQKDRTIDDVPVGHHIPVANYQPFYPSPDWTPSVIYEQPPVVRSYSPFATPLPFTGYPGHPSALPQSQPQQQAAPYRNHTHELPPRGESASPSRHPQRVRVDPTPTVINAPAPFYPTSTEERSASPSIPIMPQPQIVGVAHEEVDVVDYPRGSPVVPVIPPPPRHAPTVDQTNMPGYPPVVPTIPQPSRNATMFGQTHMPGYTLFPPVIPMYVPDSPVLQGHFPSGFKAPYVGRPPPQMNESRPLRLTKMTWIAIFLSFFLDVLPRQVYLHLLLRFPSLYFSRVTRIFRDTHMGMKEIKQMALEAANSKEAMSRELLYQGVLTHQSPAPAAPSSFMNLRSSWQAFIDSLMREWKTLNIIAVLLLSAILTILQIDAAAANPISRYSALMSLVCAFMSLLYGCIYIIRFGSMRKTYKAAEWANESERSSTAIFWNVWVMLAMPAVWLGWSMIFFITCIMAFVWQTGTANDADAPTQTASDILVPRIVISAVLGLGFLYLVLIGITFRRYGDPMEQAWQERIKGWLNETAAGTSHSQSHAHAHMADSTQQRPIFHYGNHGHQPYPNHTTPRGHPWSGNFTTPIIPQTHHQLYPPFGAIPTPPASGPWTHRQPSRFKEETHPSGRYPESAPMGDDDSINPRTAQIDEEHAPLEGINRSTPQSNWVPGRPGPSRVPQPSASSGRHGFEAVDSHGDKQPVSTREVEHEPARRTKLATLASIPEEPPTPRDLTHPTLIFAQIEKIEQCEEKDGVEASNAMLEVMRMKPGGVVTPATALPQKLLDREYFIHLWPDVSEAITTAWLRIEKPDIQQDLSSWPTGELAFREFLRSLEEQNQSLSQYGVSLAFVEHNRDGEASEPNEFSVYLGSTDENPLVNHSGADGESLHRHWIVDSSRGLSRRPPKIVYVRSK